MEDGGFCAMGLDSQQRKITSIGSNPGHCLATAIADKAMVQHTADRLFAPDLFSGLGRAHALGATSGVQSLQLSSRLSLAGRAGDVRDRLHALRPARPRGKNLSRSIRGGVAVRYVSVAGAVQRARSRCQPSVSLALSGRQRSAGMVGVRVVSDAASDAGLYPYAPLHMLLLDPHLPSWLPEITLRDLRLAEATATIRFFRKENGASDYHVLEHRRAGASRPASHPASAEPVVADGDVRRTARRCVEEFVAGEIIPTAPFRAPRTSFATPPRSATAAA